MARELPNETDRMIGARVRLYRTRANMSAAALASELGISYQQYSKIETGVHKVTADRLAKISLKLNVSIEVFFDGLGQTTLDEEAASLVGAYAQLPEPLRPVCRTFLMQVAEAMRAG